MINLDIDTKCKIDYTSEFKKQLKKVVKQGKDTKLLLEIITRLANHEKLELKHRDHHLIKKHKNFPITKLLERYFLNLTKASIILMLTLTAISLLRRPDNIMIPCSVKT